jgi:hypothetical protein
VLAQSNTNTQCNVNSFSYCYANGNTCSYSDIKSYSYIDTDADGYAKIYSVAKAAPHAASSANSIAGRGNSDQ